MDDKLGRNITVGARVVFAHRRDGFTELRVGKVTEVLEDAPNVLIKETSGQKHARKPDMVAVVE